MWLMVVIIIHRIMYMAVSMFLAPHWLLEFMMEVGILVDVTASGQNIDNIAIPFFITLTIEKFGNW